MAYLIFDYDGTLHNTILIYRPALQKAYDYLAKQGFRTNKILSDEEAGRWLGFNAKDMWNAFAPDLSPKLHQYCSTIVGEEMQQQIDIGSAKLYPKALDVLSKLKSQGHRLIFLSNCKISYLNMHQKQFELERYFSAFYCTEAFDWKTKEEIFPAVKQDMLSVFPNEEPTFIAIGDRFHDLNLALRHNLPFVGCNYGFGTAEELQQSTCIAHSAEEIEICVHQLLHTNLSYL